jgi:hypothetical protein
VTLFSPRKPDEYFLPESDNGSWNYQLELEQQMQESQTGEER